MSIDNRTRAGRAERTVEIELTAERTLEPGELERIVAALLGEPEQVQVKLAAERVLESEEDELARIIQAAGLGWGWGRG